MGFFDRFKKEKKEEKSAPSSVDSAMWFSNATSHLRHGQYDAALHCFDKAIESDPENPVAWHEKGRVLAMIKSEEKSLAAYDKAISLRPDVGVYYHNKGDALVSYQNCYFSLLADHLVTFFIIFIDCC